MTALEVGAWATLTTVVRGGLLVLLLLWLVPAALRAHRRGLERVRRGTSRHVVHPPVYVDRRAPGCQTRGGEL